MAIERIPAVERVPPSDWPALARFIFRHNRLGDGGVRCLHGDQGDDEAAQVAEAAALKPGDAAFWCMADGGETVGAIGCEIDLATGRAWVRGPWTVAGAQAGAMAAALLHALESGLPAVRRLDAFPSEADAPLNALYRDAGYRRVDLHRVMQAPLDPLPARPDVAVAAATRADLAQWLPLHRELFPASYLSDDDLEAALDDAQRRVLTATQDGRAVGYLVAKDEPGMDEVYVDYLGVDPAWRGRGIGRALLREALCWGGGRGRRHAALTVRQDREAALSVYRQCGFVQIRAGVHWCKER